MRDTPLVSIGAINYNNCKYLVEALDSIKNQTYQNIELIVVDDCSTDDSVSLIKAWLERYEKPYKLILHEKNQGVQKTCADALAHASGKYFSFLATDDVIYVDKIVDQVAEFINDEIGIVYGDCEMIDDQGRVLQPSMFAYLRGQHFDPPSGSIFEEVLNGFYFYTQASLINLECFRTLEYHFNPEIISEDWDIELRLTKKYQAVGMRKVVTKYRRLNTSVTATNWNAENMFKVLVSHFKMIYSLYDRHADASRDNFLIGEKLQKLYWQIYPLAEVSYIDKIDLYRKVVEVSRSWRVYTSFLFVLTRSVFFLEFITKMKTKVKPQN